MQLPIINRLAHLNCSIDQLFLFVHFCLSLSSIKYQEMEDYFIYCSEPEDFDELLSGIRLELEFLLYGRYSEIIVQGRYDARHFDNEGSLRILSQL